jgi:hypothetical protein
VNNHIVIQAHSSPVLYYEAIFAIYSLGVYEDLSNYYFLIYTDNIAFFQPYLKQLKVSYHSINPEILREWKGPCQFIHRVKIKMLQDVASLYQGNFLYVDSDVCFQKSITNIFEGIAQNDLYLHRSENQLRDVRMYKPLINYSANIGGVSYAVAADTYVWNAGVIGFNSYNAEKLNQILALTDQIYSKYQKHIVEQFAFSFIFQLTNRVYSAEQEVLHYWFLKEEFRHYLERIFNDCSVNENLLRTIVRKINLQSDAERKIKWRSHSGLYRAYKRMMGNAFQLSQLPEVKDL